MKKELTQFYEYNNGLAHIYNPLDQVVLNDIFNSQQIIEEYEKPDLIINLEDHIIAIEHFDFDASLLINEKGSSDKKDSSDRLQKHNNCNSQNIIDYKSTSIIETVISPEIYLKNFFRSLDKHYKNISEYKRRCLEHCGNKKITIVFMVIDNTSPFLAFETNNKLRFMMLFEIKEYLFKILEYSQIEYLLYGFQYGQEKSFAFMSNKQETINKMLQEDIIPINEIYLKKSPTLETIYTRRKKDC